MKTYQSFARQTEFDQLINTEIRAENIKEARKWFKRYTYYNEKIYLKK